MMEILKDKIVITRKPHRCFACNRRFEAGSEMRAQTNIYEEINTVHNCKTCDTLMNEFPSHFLDDQENIYPTYCVSEIYYDYKVNNPEDLLIAIRAEKALK